MSGEELKESIKGIKETLGEHNESLEKDGKELAELRAFVTQFAKELPIVLQLVPRQPFAATDQVQTAQAAEQRLNALIMNFLAKQQSS